MHHSLTERVRNATRYGVVRPYDPDAIRNMVLYNQPTAVTEENEGFDGDDPEPAPGFMGLTPSMVTVSRQDATFNEDRIIVIIDNYPFRFFTPFISGVYQARPIVASLPYEGV